MKPADRSHKTIPVNLQVMTRSSRNSPDLITPSKSFNGLKVLRIHHIAVICLLFTVQYMHCLLLTVACKLQPPHTIYERITNCSAVFENVFQRALPCVSSLWSSPAHDASGWVQRSPAWSWRIRRFHLLLSCAMAVLPAYSWRPMTCSSVVSYRRGLLYSLAGGFTVYWLQWFSLEQTRRDHAETVYTNSTRTVMRI